MRFFTKAANDKQRIYAMAERQASEATCCLAAVKHLAAVKNNDQKEKGDLT